jgi:hypothetical protein
VGISTAEDIRTNDFKNSDWHAEQHPYTAELKRQANALMQVTSAAGGWVVVTITPLRTMPVGDVVERRPGAAYPMDTR